MPFCQGERIAILTGLEEHHLSADTAYAITQYRQASGDEQFFEQYGAEMLLEIARFWASRAGAGADGRYHIRKVIGPDEYHESVDDNAYTNLMARWSLRQALATAAELAADRPARWQALVRRLALADDELRAWQRVADGLVTGYDPQSGLYEQFAGYYALHPIDLRQAALIDLDFARKGWAGASGGVHIAALGGIWQALAFGFLGMQPGARGLRFMPQLPTHWCELRVPLEWRGCRLIAIARPGSIEVTLLAGAPLELAVGAGDWQLVAVGETLRGGHSA